MVASHCARDDRFPQLRPSPRDTETQRLAGRSSSLVVHLLSLCQRAVAFPNCARQRGTLQSGRDSLRIESVRQGYLVTVLHSRRDQFAARAFPSLSSPAVSALLQFLPQNARPGIRLTNVLTRAPCKPPRIGSALDIAPSTHRGGQVGMRRVLCHRVAAVWTYLRDQRKRRASL